MSVGAGGCTLGPVEVVELDNTAPTLTFFSKGEGCPPPECRDLFGGELCEYCGDDEAVVDVETEDGLSLYVHLDDDYATAEDFATTTPSLVTWWFEEDGEPMSSTSIDTPAGQAIARFEMSLSEAELHVGDRLVFQAEDLYGNRARAFWVLGE